MDSNASNAGPLGGWVEIGEEEDEEEERSWEEEEVEDRARFASLENAEVVVD